MSKQSKITIKHYPNTSLKPQTENGKEKYPLYVQVIYKSTNFKFKSENDYFKYVDNADLNNELISKMLNLEKKRIERCIDLISNNNEKLLTSKDIYKYSTPLEKIIEKNLGKLIEKEFPDAPKSLTNLSYFEIDNLLNFLDGYNAISRSEKISNVMQIVSNLGILDPFSDYYKNDYCYIDLFFGNGFIKIYEAIKATVSFNDEVAKEYLKDFRYFIDL